jgi:hypothetical protein
LIRPRYSRVAFVTPMCSGLRALAGAPSDDLVGRTRAVSRCRIGGVPRAVRSRLRFAPLSRVRWLLKAAASSTPPRDQAALDSAKTPAPSFPTPTRSALRTLGGDPRGALFGNAHAADTLDSAKNVLPLDRYSGSLRTSSPRRCAGRWSSSATLAHPADHGSAKFLAHLVRDSHGLRISRARRRSAEWSSSGSSRIRPNSIRPSSSCRPLATPTPSTYQEFGVAPGGGPRRQHSRIRPIMIRPSSSRTSFAILAGSGSRALVDAPRSGPRREARASGRT